MRASGKDLSSYQHIKPALLENLLRMCIAFLIKKKLNFIRVLACSFLASVYLNHSGVF